ncbi:extracellular solute-binding protein [Bacillus massilinigeriensis]|uniref:extracellular solute-binding protein n=1 Tax=Bacillus massilionigeriensis TaxID=1805475 RepID=UPI00096B3FCD|nr:extracellular solute-binding protein [Bacillus massilionigeriensis]
MKSFKTKLIALSLVSSLALVGCNSDSGSDKSKDEGTKDTKTEEQVVLKFAAQNDNTPATQALIDEFNKSNEKYDVEWVEMTNDSAQMHDQLLNSLSSGSSEYDVMSLDVVWAGEFAGAGYLEPIDVNMQKAEMNKEDFNSGSMASGNYKGKQYTLPFFPDLGLLYFRKDIVSSEDAAKLESGDYTYDDLYAMAEKYTGKDGTNIGLAYQSKQYEGLTVNLTEFSKSYQDLAGGLETMYKFATAKFTPKNILNYMEGESHVAFEQGKAVFERNWPYAFGRIKGKEDGVKLAVDQVGIAPLPNGGAVGGWLLSINKASENAEGAWEFIQFAAGEEGQKIMSTTGGYLPGFNSLLENDEVKAANEMLGYEGFQNALKETIARPVSPDYSKVSDTIQVNAHKYLSSGSGLDEAVSKIEEAVKAE